MKTILNGIGIIVIASCSHAPSPTITHSKEEIRWHSRSEGLNLTFVFIKEELFYKLMSSFYEIDGVEIKQNLNQLADYGCFFVEPKPNCVEIKREEMKSTVRFSGGDGGTSFFVVVEIERHRIKKWTLSGSDIKDSPLVFAEKMNTSN